MKIWTTIRCLPKREQLINRKTWKVLIQYSNQVSVIEWKNLTKLGYIFLVSENIGSEEKQFVDTLRQVEFYKYQCEAEVKKLKAELHKHNEKLLGITRGGDMRMTRGWQETEYKYNTVSHWGTVNGSMLQAEKQQKKLTEIRQELSQIQDLIDNLKREYQNKICKFVNM